MRKISVLFLYLLFVSTAAFAADEHVKENYEIKNSSFAEVVRSTTSNNVDISADTLLYDNQKDLITAVGDVKVYYKDMDLRADKLQYYRGSGLVLAQGNIRLTRNTYSFDASTMIYNINFSTGSVYGASVQSPPIYVYAKELQITAKDEFHIPKGDITTCNHVPPHYRFSGQNMKLKLNKKFSGYNTLLFIRGLPAFYYPYYSRRLGPRKLEISLDAGSSSRDGSFVKSKFSYPFTEKSRTYFGLDSMSKRGLGIKAGHNYSIPEGAADIDVYYIREKGSDTGRFYANGWHELIPSLSLRYRTEYTSNYEFNYLNDQNIYEYKQRDLYYQFGFEYSKPKYIFSLNGKKNEEWSGSDYNLKQLIVPSTSLSIYPIYIPSGLRMSFNASYDNEYQKTLTGHEYWQRDIKWAGKLDKTYRMNVGRIYSLSFIPGVGYDGVYRNSMTSYTSMFASTRHSLLRMWFLETDYQWRRVVGSPYSIVENDLGYKLMYRPIRYLSISSESSYDFRDGIEKPVGDFFSKINLAYRFLDVYVKNRYDYYASHSKEWLYELGLYNISQTRVKYNYSFPRRIEIGQNFKLKVWDALVSLGARMYFNKTGFSYEFSEDIERSVSVQWQLHCWDSEFKYIRVGQEAEFWLLFNITAMKEPRVGIYANFERDDIRYVRE